MRIAVDAMGGDFGAQPIVEGACKAFEKWDCNIILVGDENKIQAELGRNKCLDKGISIVQASQVVGMEESPKDSLRKKDSSIAVAADLVKNGKADAVVTAGNTGAALAATLIRWRTLKGISRPAIATLIPTMEKYCLLLDMGANVDCKPRNLLHFAIMGDIYMREVIGRKNPRVGVLSIGEEASKGNELTLQSAELLKQAPINFAGNAEGRDIFKGKFDVVVCDGFIGNVILKCGEAIVDMITARLKNEIKRNLFSIVGGLLLKPTLRRFKKELDVTEYGGAPLLGLNGVCIIGHGSSSAKAIMNAVNVANEAANHHINEHIIDAVNKLQIPKKEFSE